MIAPIKKYFIKNSLKRNILKNKDAMLDILAENVKGARCCPFLGGQKCIGQFCEHFMEFSNYDETTKKKTSFWRCAHVQQPLLTIELNNNIRHLISLFQHKNSE